jgi:hypothetical protein
MSASVTAATTTVIACGRCCRVVEIAKTGRGKIIEIIYTTKVGCFKDARAP